MKFLNRVRATLRAFFIPSTKSGKSAKNLSQYEKDLLLRMDSRAGSVSNDSSPVLIAKTAGSTKDVYHTQKNQARRSEHNK